MIATGDNITTYIQTASFLDLVSTNTTCNTIKNYPLITTGASGLLYENAPLICGGSGTNLCYTYMFGYWYSFPPLNQSKVYHAMSYSPFSDNPSMLMVTGNKKYYFKKECMSHNCYYISYG